jgi:hypothetical protein
MKKIFITSLLVLISGFTAFSQNGIIREFTGDVTLRPAGAADFVPAAAGAAVARDTIVSTGFRSTAVITVGSSTITVRPLTRLSLSEIQSSAEAENVNLNLQTGRVRVDVNPPAGSRANLTVQSPSSTASVRGTSFEVDARNLQVIEGRVIFTGNNGFQSVVSAGASSLITSDGRAQDPVIIAASELVPPAPVGTGTSGESVVAPAAASPFLPPPDGSIVVTPTWR